MEVSYEILCYLENELKKEYEKNMLSRFFRRQKIKVLEELFMSQLTLFEKMMDEVNKPV